MAEKDQNQGIDSIEINETINKAEGYISENKKSISIIVGAVLVVILGYFGYTNLIVKPQEENAIREMFMAERYFQMDSVNLAINGDGQFMGFQEIIDNYGSSSSANRAHYYLGMCYMKKGEWDNAIEYLSGYDAEDDVTGALALGAIGDANLEKGNNEEALNYYMKAVDWDKNQFTAAIFLLKAATVKEIQNDYKGATDLYERIKKDYPQSTEARDIDRYIARASQLSAKG
ncbi:MAG: Tetratricopeptide repeat protein [Bacteroidetes bacterium ADurb.Bin397]|nr:MAG: Tetratricopeptide repeat protein [Bacteroidetes bacterium ADurb.Bin397]